MERNVPKLRFKGFNDEWKIDKLNENTYIKGRIGWKNLKQEEYTLKGPYLIAGKHINEGIINWDKCDHISEERYEESMEIALKDDDIIFSKDGSIGNPALIQNLKVKATINGTMMLIRLDQNEYEPSYFYQILKSEYFEKLIRNVKSGSSIPHIFQRDMIEFKFPVPGTLQEQKRIANFLTKVDKIIEKQEEKVKNLENYKKGMMQKIFSQEIRFKDENGEEYPDWEEKKLGELDIKLTRGPFGSDLKKEDMVQKNTDTYKVYEQKHAINKNCKLGTYYINREKYLKLKRFEVKVGDFIMSCSGTIGEIYKIPDDAEKGIINQALLKIEVQKSINENYFLYCFRENLNKLEVKGSGIKNITSVKFLKEEFTLQVPFIEEQKKISDFLSNIDNIILNENNKLEELKQWKKGLLQQMFI